MLENDIFYLVFILNFHFPQVILSPKELLQMDYALHQHAVMQMEFLALTNC